MAHSKLTAELVFTDRFVDFCRICSRVYTDEKSYRRHVAYCSKAQYNRKGRPISCQRCKGAKAKCSFTKPQCSRCAAKGFLCIYGTENLSLAMSSAEIEPGHSTSLLGPAADNSPINTPYNAWNEVLGRNSAVLQKFSAHATATPPSSGRLSQGTIGFEHFAGFIDQLHTAYSLQSNVGQAGAQSAVSKNDIVIASRTAAPIDDGLGLLTHGHSIANMISFSESSPASIQVINIIAQMISAFPRMMARRSTFPPFIHPHWNQERVPLILGDCMAIAQLFVSAATETRALMWRMIDSERDRLKTLQATFSPEELLQAMQVTSIYILMAIVGGNANPPERGVKLFELLRDLKRSLRMVINTMPPLTFDYMYYRQTWQTWIFTESYHRTECLWLAIGRIFSVRTGHGDCLASRDVLDLLLPSSKYVWEARTELEWNMELENEQTGHRMHTFRDLLIAIRSSSVNTRYAEQLDKWEASVDKIGTIMQLTATSVLKVI